MTATETYLNQRLAKRFGPGNYLLDYNAIQEIKSTLKDAQLQKVIDHLYQTRTVRLDLREIVIARASTRDWANSIAVILDLP